MGGNTQSKSRPLFTSFEVPNSEGPGRGPIFRHPLYKNELLNFYVDEDGKTFDTSHCIFKIACEKFAGRDFHGTREIKNGQAGPFQWQNYGEIYRRALNFGRGLMEFGLIPKDDQNMRLLAIYMKNRSEWIIAEQGCFLFSGTTVPMYDTLGDNSIEHVLKETECKTCVCTEAEVEKLLKGSKNLETFQTILIVGDSISAATKEMIEKEKKKFFLFAQIEEKGKKSALPVEPPTPDHIATFSYTSGTTGLPKGALISQGNLAANVASFLAFFDSYPELEFFGTPCKYLSYLPLAHVMERLGNAMLTIKGAAIGFYQGEPLKIPADMEELKPTIFASVPRLLTRIYDKIVNRVNSSNFLKKMLFNRALNVKLENLKSGNLKHFFYDKIVFNKIKEKVGLGDIKVVVSGSAPLPPHVMDFLRVFLGVPVIEAYGQTEATCLISSGDVCDFSSGHVGMPVPGFEICLFDVPELNYFSSDKFHGEEKTPCKGRGEICVRGASNFKGYFKMPDKTAETIDEEGWIHTGDIGIWTDDLQLKIVDRKKNIFKLSQGEYVAPEKIEQIVCKSLWVAQCFVHGDSFNASTVAVVVLDRENLPKLLEEKSIKFDEIENLTKDPKVKEEILKDVQKICKIDNLKGFEIPKDVFVTNVLFSVENDLLTPTFKLKRNVAVKFFGEEIKKMYKNIKEN